MRAEKARTRAVRGGTGRRREAGGQKRERGTVRTGEGGK